MNKSKLRWMIAAALMLMIVFCLSAAAAGTAHSGTCGDGLVWELDEDGTLTIAGQGEMTQYTSGSAVPWYAYRQQITGVVIGDGVGSISPFAFSGYSGIISVEFQDTDGSLTRVEDAAFNNCTGLQQVHISSVRSWVGIQFTMASSNPLEYAEHLYLNGSELTDVVIPDGVTAIGDYAFLWDTGLRSVTIPASVTSIGSYAFRKCTGLTEITLPDGLTYLGMNAFSGCSGLRQLSVPAGVTNPYGGAFEGCTGLTAVTLQEGLTEIPMEFFANCTALRGINVPEGVTVIGEHAFRYCESLLYANLPGSLTEIGGFAFDGCTSMTNMSYEGTERDWLTVRVGNVNDPLLNALKSFYGDPAIINSGTCGTNLTWTLDANGVLVITGTGAMKSYNNLDVSPWYQSTAVRKVAVGDGVTSIGDEAFQECENMTVVNLPDSITRIGSGAFFWCTSLSTVRIPENVTFIGSGAFAHNHKLKKAVIPEGVTSIDVWTFGWCEQLETVTLPDSLLSIGDSAFYCCTRLETIFIPWKVSSIGWGVFDDCPSLRSITVQSANTAYASEDGVLFNKNKTELIRYPEGKSADPYSIPESVTKIREHAFYRSSPYGIVIPSGLSVIEDGAFFQCHSVQYFELTGVSTSLSVKDGVLFDRSGEKLILYPSGRPDFFYVVPDGVKRIGNYAFASSLALGSVVLPGSVTAIGDYAFCESGIQSIYIPDSVTSIGESAFMWSYLTAVRLPGGISRIAANTFYYCQDLKMIEIPSGVTSIGEQAFKGCESLAHVYYPGSQTSWNAISVGSDNEPLTRAFLHCDMHMSDVNAGTCGSDAYWTLTDDGLLTVCGSGAITDMCPWPWDKVIRTDIAEGITGIGEKAFRGCVYMKYVSIPASVTEIGTAPFAGCNSLENIWVDLENPSYVSYESVLFDINWQRLIAFPAAAAREEYTMPFTVEEIESYAFYNCQNLKSVFIPQKVTVIGDYAFSGCTNLTQIRYNGTKKQWARIAIGETGNEPLYTAGFQFADTEYERMLKLPEGLTTIESEAFSGLWGIDAVFIPGTVTSIADDAFFDTYVYILTTEDSYAAEWAQAHGFPYLIP